MILKTQPILKAFVLWISIVFNLPVQAQERMITGKIMDERGKPLIGVNILAVKFLEVAHQDQKNEGTISNIDGNFKLTSDAKYLKMSYTGYLSKVVEIEDKSFYKITLFPRNYYFNAPTIVGHLHHPHLSLPITRKDLAALDPIAINEVLSSKPGVQFQSGSLNTNRLSIRGVGARSPFATSGIKAFIGEIPIHDLLGESSIEDIGLQFFDKVALIKGHTGPGLSNGIGGAVLMDINYEMPLRKVYLDGIRFRSPDYEEKKRKDLLIQSHHNIGAHGLVQNQISASFKTQRKDGENLIIKAKFGLLNSDGYRSNNSVDRKNFQSSFYHEMKRGVILKGILSHTNLDAQIPSSLSLTDYQNEPQKAAFIWEQSKGFERYQKTISGLTLNSTDTRFDIVSMSGYIHRLSSLELRPFNTLDTEAYSLGARLKVKDQVKEGKHFRMNWTGGLDAQMDFYQLNTLETIDTEVGDLIVESKDRIGQYNLYQKLDYVSGDLKLELGFDLGLRQVPSIENENKTHLTFAPHLDLRKNILPENTLYLRSGKGYLYPTPDQYIDENGQFNKDLLPSKGYHIEAGLKNTSTYLGTPIRYHVAFYQIFMQNQLTSIQGVNGASTWTNGGSTNLGGIELGMNYTKTLEKHSLSIELAHSENIHRFGDFAVTGDQFDGNKWTGSPNRSSYARFAYGYQGLECSLRGHYVGEMPVDDANTTFNEDYFLLKSRIGYSHTFWGDKLTIASYIEVDNLGDIEYSPMVQVNAFKSSSGARYYYPGLPRNVLGGIRASVRL